MDSICGVYLAAVAAVKAKAEAEMAAAAEAASTEAAVLGHDDDKVERDSRRLSKPERMKKVNTYRNRRSINSQQLSTNSLLPMCPFKGSGAQRHRQRTFQGQKLCICGKTLQRWTIPHNQIL